MQKSRRLIILGLVVTVVTSAVWLTTAFADDSIMTDAQVSRIRTDCVSAKNTLNQIHADDALLRVNRGQMYESLTSDLMSPFNSRVQSNNLDASDLVAITNSYGATLTSFRNDYQTYEGQLSTALQIDCTKQPVEFYDAVDSARTDRNQVHTDVVALNQDITQYTTAFNTFSADFLSTTGAQSNG